MYQEQKFFLWEMGERAAGRDTQSQVGIFKKVAGILAFKLQTMNKSLTQLDRREGRWE